MRRKPRLRSSGVFMGISITPLVDMIFTLSIFYMLVAKFSSAEQTPMQLPKPVSSQAVVTKIPERIVINCRLADPNDPGASPALYSLGPNRPEALGTISDRLGAMKQRSPDINVVVRADRRLRYEYIRAVLRVAARNRIEMVNVVAHVGEED